MYLNDHMRCNGQKLSPEGAHAEPNSASGAGIGWLPKVKCEPLGIPIQPINMDRALKAGRQVALLLQSSRLKVYK